MRVYDCSKRITKLSSLSFIIQKGPFIGRLFPACFTGFPKAWDKYKVHLLQKLNLGFGNHHNAAAPIRFIFFSGTAGHIGVFKPQVV